MPTETIAEPSAIVQRLEWPDQSLSREAAESLLQIRFAPSDVERMNQLAMKAQNGTLTKAQREESLQYDLVGHLIGVLHSRARRVLKKKS